MTMHAEVKMPGSMAEVETLAFNLALSRACAHLANMPGGRPSNRTALVNALRRRSGSVVKLFVLHPAAVAEALEAASVPRLAVGLTEELRARLPSNLKANLEVPPAVVDRVTRRLTFSFPQGLSSTSQQVSWMAQHAYCLVQVALDAVVCQLEERGVVTVVGGTGKIAYDEDALKQHRGPDGCQQFLDAWPLAPAPRKLHTLPFVENTCLVIVPPPETWRKFVEVKRHSLVAPLGVTCFPHLALFWKFVPCCFLDVVLTAISKALERMPPFSIVLDTVKVEPGSGAICVYPRSEPATALSELQEALSSVFPQGHRGGFDANPRIQFIKYFSQSKAEKELEKWKAQWEAVSFDVRHVFLLKRQANSKGKGKGRFIKPSPMEPWTVAAATPFDVPASEEPILRVGSSTALDVQCPEDYQQLEHEEVENKIEIADRKKLAKGKKFGYSWDRGPIAASECADIQFGYQPEEIGVTEPKTESKGRTNAAERGERKWLRSVGGRKKAEKAELKKEARHREDSKRLAELERRRARDAKIPLNRTVSNSTAGGEAPRSTGGPALELAEEGQKAVGQMEEGIAHPGEEEKKKPRRRKLQQASTAEWEKWQVEDVEGERES